MLLDGVDLAAKTSSFLRKDPTFASRASEDIFHQMLDEIVLGICFDIHKTIRTGSYSALQLTAEESPPMPIAGHVDVFGLAVTTITGLPSLKTVPQIECPNCSNRTLAASRFAPHLEKCMGMGRNSSRVASRRLATTNKDSYRDGGHEEEDDDDDEWVEPGKKDMRRKRDKNSPRRNKSLKYKEFKGENSDGMVTPPQSYDQLSLEDRRKLLTSVCGVTLTNNKICLRPTRCGAHTDIQRREVRLKWLGGKQEVEDIDMDSDTDTIALRESLSQLSNASSPAESVVSTSSNPGLSSSSSRQPGRQRDRNKRGKKGRPGSKNGSSRGSTPPMEH